MLLWISFIIGYIWIILINYPHINRVIYVGKVYFKVVNDKYMIYRVESKADNSLRLYDINGVIHYMHVKDLELFDKATKQSIMLSTLSIFSKRMLLIDYEFISDLDIQYTD